MTEESHPEIMGHYNRMCVGSILQLPPPVYIYDDDIPNAQVSLKNLKTGHLINYIECSRGLLELLDARETAAVLAHEMGHALHEAVPAAVVWDWAKGTIGAVVTAGAMDKVINTVAAMVRKNVTMKRRGFLRMTATGVASLAVGTNTLKSSAFSGWKERSERASDAKGAELMGDIGAMISALEKINDWGKEHVTSYDSASMDKRIDALRKMAVEQEKSSARSLSP